MTHPAGNPDRARPATASERQQAYRARRRSVSVDLPIDVAEMLRDLRLKTGLTTHGVLLEALGLLLGQIKTGCDDHRHAGQSGGQSAEPVRRTPCSQARTTAEPGLVGHAASHAGATRRRLLADLPGRPRPRR